jgi:hypothetical protein
MCDRSAGDMARALEMKLESYPERLFADPIFTRQWFGDTR